MNDKDNIAELVCRDLTTADEVEQRVLGVLAGYVGGQGMLMVSLLDTVARCRQVEAVYLDA